MQAYLADVAGLHLTLHHEGAAGLDLRLEGFSHKLPRLAALAFAALAALAPGDEAFQRVREALARAYRNANVKPLRHASYLRLRALRTRAPEVDAVRAEIEAATAADARAFAAALFSPGAGGRLHVEALVHGNATAADARAIGDVARRALGAAGAPGLRDAAARLPPRADLLVRAPAANGDEDNSVAEVYLQVGPSSNPAARARLDMVDQLL